ncbi:MAG: cyclic nucleotide-binding domain-containing protein [Deltaproteobacteria bacterium]|nr:cyclic nucleotide-binding domain-containing protein [Candidatus Zymogenaceae bacterium]
MREIDSLYGIVTGRLSIFRNDEFGNEIWISNLEEGSFFGEFGFFSNARRFASVKADVKTTFFELTKRDADTICRSHPGMKNVFISFYKKRVLDTLLAASPLFSPLAPSRMAAILEHFTPARFAAGDVVIKQDTQIHVSDPIKDCRRRLSRHRRPNAYFPAPTK